MGSGFALPGSVVFRILLPAAKGPQQIEDADLAFEQSEDLFEATPRVALEQLLATAGGQTGVGADLVDLTDQIGRWVLGGCRRSPRRAIVDLQSRLGEHDAQGVAEAVGVPTGDFAPVFFEPTDQSATVGSPGKFLSELDCAQAPQANWDCPRMAPIFWAAS